MIRYILTICFVAWFIGGPSAAQPLAKELFGAERVGSNQRANPIGEYARGCLAGGVQLAETGPTWQAMRLSRNRNWAHPETVDYVERLSRFAARLPGWNGLYIGDMSQPRGGPMLTGHRSHQSGLDIDIWMLPPKRLNLSRGQRESLSSISVRASNQRGVNGNWTPQHAAILQRAASDPAVDRIFVTPPVKIEMCKTATRSDRDWLQKIRPIYGHHYHFHVRLKCPKDSPGCVTQSPSVRELSNGGYGCDDTLMLCVTDYLNPPKTTKPTGPAPPPRRSARDFTMADLPRQCQTVLASNCSRCSRSSACWPGTFWPPAPRRPSM